jgi:hypothetical protein
MLSSESSTRAVIGFIEIPNNGWKKVVALGRTAQRTGSRPFPASMPISKQGACRLIAKGRYLELGTAGLAHARLGDLHRRNHGCGNVNCAASALHRCCNTAPAEGLR